MSNWQWTQEFNAARDQEQYLRSVQDAQTQSAATEQQWNDATRAAYAHWNDIQAYMNTLDPSSVEYQAAYILRNGPEGKVAQQNSAAASADQQNFENSLALAKLNTGSSGGGSSSGDKSATGKQYYDVLMATGTITPEGAAAIDDWLGAGATEQLKRSLAAQGGGRLSEGQLWQLETNVKNMLVERGNKTGGDLFLDGLPLGGSNVSVSVLGSNGTPYTDASIAKALQYIESFEASGDITEAQANGIVKNLGLATYSYTGR
jgi:hypothetical protein